MCRSADRGSAPYRPPSVLRPSENIPPSCLLSADALRRSDRVGLAAALSDLPHAGKRDGCGVPEPSSAPHPPNGGVSEDATPQFHLCVGVSVHGRDDGGAVPELHVQLRRGPDLADAHAALHPHSVRAGAAHAHLHPPGPEQGQTPGAAAAPPAARTHRQVGAVSTCSSPPLSASQPCLHISRLLTDECCCCCCCC